MAGPSTCFRGGTAGGRPQTQRSTDPLVPAGSPCHQRAEIHAILFLHSDFRVQKMIAIGQKYRETGLTPGFGYVGGNAAGRRYSLDRRGIAGRRKHDHAVAAPRSAAAVSYTAKR